MQVTALFVAVSLPTMIAMFLPLVMSGERSRAAEEKAHGRRLAHARMNARLLRLNL